MHGTNRRDAAHEGTQAAASRARLMAYGRCFSNTSAEEGSPISNERAVSVILLALAALARRSRSHRAACMDFARAL